MTKKEIKLKGPGSITIVWHEEGCGGANAPYMMQKGTKYSIFIEEYK